MPHDDDLLRLLLNRPPEGLKGTPLGGGLPDLPPSPSWTRPEPKVFGGGQEVGRAVSEMFTKLPELRGQVPKVSYGPDAGTMYEMVRSKLPIDAFAESNLLGGTDTRNNAIALRPDLKGKQLKDVLRHELAHVAGYEETPTRLMDMLFEKGQYPGDGKMNKQTVAEILMGMKGSRKK